MQLGFIGLGHLGAAIAGRLVTCGHTLTTWNRSAGKAPSLEHTPAASPRALSEDVDVIFLCLFDSQAVHDVLTGPEGLLSGDLAGKTVIDLSTNHYNEVGRFHTICKAAGADYVESPVLGSVVPATNGALTVVVSGEAAAFERIKPLLENIGQNLFFLGEAGLATKMKLVNNLALGSIMATIAETLAMGEAAGIARGDVLDILSVGGGKSLVLDAKKQKLLEGDFSTHFSNALIYKDLHCLQDLAYELKKPLHAAASVKELYARTFEEGFAHEDFSSIYRLFERR